MSEQPVPTNLRSLAYWHLTGVAANIPDAGGHVEADGADMEPEAKRALPENLRISKLGITFETNPLDDRDELTLIYSDGTSAVMAVLIASRQGPDEPAYLSELSAAQPITEMREGLIRRLGKEEARFAQHLRQAGAAIAAVG